MTQLRPQPHATATLDFWSESGPAMCAFQAFANNLDWYTTLSKLADAIHAELKPIAASGRELVGADLGTGFCHSIRDVIGLLHFRYGTPTYWHGFEPDRDISNVVSSKTLYEYAGETPLPGVVSLTPSLEHLFQDQRGRCAIATLMHSVYYCNDAVELVTRIHRELLGSDGSVVILQLSEDSPFYLLDEFRPRNGTYALTAAFPDSVVWECPMRFRIPMEIAEASGFQRAMFALMSRGQCHASVFNEFREKFLDVFGGGRTVDLRDEIVIIPKRGR